jgi:hypothetical protein
MNLNYTTTISNLKDQIDIKTDLTHWDVSHASDAQKAFFNAATFNQNIGSWDVSQVIHTIVVTLLTSQLPISWLKALALESI